MTERGTSAVPVLAVSGRGEIEPGSGCGVSGAVAADGGAITVHHTRPQWAGLLECAASQLPHAVSGDVGVRL
jgi:hypothetical protein